MAGRGKRSLRSFPPIDHGFFESRGADGYDTLRIKPSQWTGLSSHPNAIAAGIGCLAQVELCKPFYFQTPIGIMGAPLTSLRDAISEILLSRDFEIVEKDGYLMGRKKDVEAVFCLLPRFVEEEYDLFVERFRDFQGRKIVCTLDSVPDTVEESLAPEVFIWDREAIEHEIGRTMVEGMLGERDHGLVDELSADDYPKMVSPEELEDVELPELGERIVKPVIDMMDVREISRQTVGGFRHRLELVPYYVFDYACALYLDEDRVSTENGTLAINALTRKVESWPGSLEVVYAIESNHRRLEPMIDLEEAKAILHREVIQRHTYEKELIRDEGSVTVIEKKVLSPKDEDVLLDPLGIYYLPIWCVEGVHGVMIINAGTGKVISEDYYRA